MKFRRLGVDARYDVAKKCSVCFNCLRSGHDSNSCSINYFCKLCNAKHHTLLHFKFHQNEDQPSSSRVSSFPNSNSPVVHVASHNIPESIKSQASFTVNTSDAYLPRVSEFNPVDSELQCLNAISKFQTLLPTALINVRDVSGKLQLVRVLIDSASTASFITESLVRRLGLRKTSCLRSLTGIGNTPAGTCKGLVSLCLQSRFDPALQIKINALVLNKVTSSIPAEYISVDNGSRLISLQLADPGFYKPGTVDILLGAERALHILTGKRHDIDENIVALSTIFGFIIGGQSGNDTSNHLDTQTSLSTVEDLNSTLKLFWQLEDVNHFYNSKLDAEAHFVKNVSRNSEGKLIVKLPFLTNHLQLGN